MRHAETELIHKVKLYASVIRNVRTNNGWPKTWSDTDCDPTMGVWCTSIVTASKPPQQEVKVR